MQRVHPAIGVDGTPGRHQRLPCDLAAEHSLAVLVRAHAPEQVDLELLQLEQIDEIVQRAPHSAPMLPAAA